MEKQKPFAPVSRTTDPNTSAIAEKRVTQSGKRRRQVDLIAKIVAIRPGRTSAELAALHGTDAPKYRHTYCRRLPDAERLGMVHRGPTRHCRVSHQLCLTWWPQSN